MKIETEREGERNDICELKEFLFYGWKGKKKIIASQSQTDIKICANIYEKTHKI